MPTRHLVLLFAGCAMLYPIQVRADFPICTAPAWAHFVGDWANAKKKEGESSRFEHGKKPFQAIAAPPTTFRPRPGMPGFINFPVNAPKNVANLQRIGLSAGFDLTGQYSWNDSTPALLMSKSTENAEDLEFLAQPEASELVASPMIVMNTTSPVRLNLGSFEDRFANESVRRTREFEKAPQLDHRSKIKTQGNNHKLTNFSPNTIFNLPGNHFRNPGHTITNKSPKAISIPFTIKPSPDELAQAIAKEAPEEDDIQAQAKTAISPPSVVVKPNPTRQFQPGLPMGKNRSGHGNRHR